MHPTVFDSYHYLVSAPKKFPGCSAPLSSASLLNIQVEPFASTTAKRPKDLIQRARRPLGPLTLPGTAMSPMR